VICDQDAVLGRGVNVDAVDANAEFGDEAELGQRLDDATRDARAAGSH
jgi:hypothetical protein